jgi:uncharacterized membrane protein
MVNRRRRLKLRAGSGVCPIMKTAMMIPGVLCVLIGLLWIGQGAGAIDWPQSSFMIRQTQWAYYGAALAALGVALLWHARR